MRQDKYEVLTDINHWVNRWERKITVLPYRRILMNKCRRTERNIE